MKSAPYTFNIASLILHFVYLPSLVQLYIEETEK